MLRTIFTIGIMALLGLVALKIVFGVLPLMVGLLIFVVGLAVKVALVGGALYLVLRVASPDGSPVKGEILAVMRGPAMGD